jgi:hypothetical protein
MEKSSCELSTSKKSGVADRYQPPSTEPPIHISTIDSTVSSGDDWSPEPFPPEPEGMNPSSVLPPTQAVMSPAFDNHSRPTCSLNLMCYGSGRQGCKVISRSRWNASMDPLEDWKDNPNTILNNQKFFHALHREYQKHICGFWRRYLSLKALRQIRLSSYTPTTRPEVVSMDDLTLQEIFYEYQHLFGISTDTDWIHWVFRLRQADHRHALEFVEGGTYRINTVGASDGCRYRMIGERWRCTIGVHGCWIYSDCWYF